MNQPTTRHEVVVDTEIAAAFEKMIEAERQLERAAFTVAEYSGRNLYVGRHRRNVTVDADLLAEVAAHAESHPWDRRSTESAITAWEDATAAEEEAHAAYGTASAQYEGWSRFFLVTSSNNGHIHRDMFCSTCNNQTGFGWLPALSGLTEADAVASQGAILCTVCYPSAPVEYTNQYELDEAAKAAESCPGSGKPGVEGGSRQGFCSGTFHTCTVCGETVGGAGYNVRKHKAA